MQGWWYAKLKRTIELKLNNKMNIQTLAEIIRLFKSEIIESGFKRDVQDYSSSLGNNQSNIVALRDIANKVFVFLERLENSDFPDSLNKLLPDKKAIPFTKGDSFVKLTELLIDAQIEQAQFFQKLNGILSQLNTRIQENITQIDQIEKFIAPYLTVDKEIIAEENRAIISIIFKENQTITNLKYFTKNIAAWNRILPIYHQILKSSTPEDIEIIEVQNGSIDFVFNFDFDIALNLVDLFKEGFKLYLAYLSYKTMSKPIADTFFGNKKLLENQKEIEKGLLENISLGISAKISQQHEIARELDEKIDDKIDKKVEQVTKLIASHIIKGNEVKILSIPESDDKEKEKEENKITITNELRSASNEIRNKLKSLPPEEMKALLDKYGSLNDDNDEKNKS